MSRVPILRMLAGDNADVYRMLNAALESSARTAIDPSIWSRYQVEMPATEATADRVTQQTIVTANALIDAASILLREANRKIERRTL